MIEIPCGNTSYGLAINNATLIKTLGSCTQVTKLCMYNDTGSASTTIDLTSCTSLKSLTSRSNACTIVIPSNLETVSSEDWRIDFSNGSGVKNITFSWGNSSLYQSQIASLCEDLANSSNLNSLSFSFNSTTVDLSSIELLKNSSLKTLTLKTTSSGSGIVAKASLTNFDGVVKLTGLTNLSINNCQLTNMPSLEKLTSLTNLDLSYNSITDLDFLASTTSLQTLTLNDNQICDLKPLENLTSLKTLNLQNNTISDQSYYADDEGTKIYYNNLDIIAGLKTYALTTVYLSGNGGIIDWSPVSSISGWDSSTYSGW